MLGNGPRLQLEIGDSVRWKAGNVGVYKVSVAYKWCELVNGQTTSSTGLIWNNLSPPKAKFITWLAWKGRLKTVEFLYRIGVLRGNAELFCVFC